MLPPKDGVPSLKNNVFYDEALTAIANRGFYKRRILLSHLRSTIGELGLTSLFGMGRGWDPIAIVT